MLEDNTQISETNNNFAPPEQSETNTALKRSFSEFVSMNDQKNDHEAKPVKKISMDLTFDADIDKKLYGLSKQIGKSISNIKIAPDNEAKTRKLKVWKDVINTIIGLTKQMVLEYNGQYYIANKAGNYESFLEELNSQLTEINNDSTGRLVNPT